MQTNNAEYTECKYKYTGGAEYTIGAEGREQSR